MLDTFAYIYLCGFFGISLTTLFKEQGDYQRFIRQDRSHLYPSTLINILVITCILGFTSYLCYVITNFKGTTVLVMEYSWLANTYSYNIMYLADNINFIINLNLSMLII